MIERGGSTSCCDVPKPLHVLEDRCEVGADADGAVGLVRHAIDREHEAHSQALDHVTDTRCAGGGVRHHAAVEVGIEFGDEVPHPVRLAREERFAAGEVGKPKVGDERAEVLEELVVVDLRKGRTLFALRADRR